MLVFLRHCGSDDARSGIDIHPRSKCLKRIFWQCDIDVLIHANTHTARNKSCSKSYHHRTREQGSKHNWQTSLVLQVSTPPSRPSCTKSEIIATGPTINLQVQTVGPFRGKHIRCGCMACGKTSLRNKCLIINKYAGQ